MDLGSKLCPGPCFLTYYGSQIEIMDADYPILNQVAPALKHLKLLVVDCPDDPILALKLRFKREVHKTIKLFFNRFEVPPQVLKLWFYPLSDCLFLRVFVLRYL